jgi:hypothetical protein
MKLPTLVVIIQAVCAALVGAAIPMGAALAQWVSADTPPSRVAWAIIILGGVAGGGSKLASFLSTSFADYKSNGAADPAVSVILPVAKALDAK